MAGDPKAEAARKHVEEALKKMKANRLDSSKIDSLIKEGNALKGDKDNPH
ncbi:MAG: hypothetical protein JNN08_04350 [Bryobacterales bacterium]|nr:hypothetical protein [Bryobacterales bacterium]